MPVVGTKAAASAQGFGEFAQASTAAVYIEDVFSTYLYTGNGSTQTITNGIDLAGKGGVVWVKSRSNAYDNWIAADASSTKLLITNATDAAYSNTGGFANWQYTSSGFNLLSTAGSTINGSGSTFTSWTFRKQPKFFDVVTYTGNGVNGRNISHNLGSVPGCIIVKNTSNSENWAVYHRSNHSGGNDPQNYALYLNTTAGTFGAGFWNNTAPTSTVFTVANDSRVNTSGDTYVAYLFAHNAGGFGNLGTDNVISCGSFNNSTRVELGYEPQWIICKSTASGQWWMQDNMRSMSLTNTATLQANTSSAENNWGISLLTPDATGFTPTGFGEGNPYIYIAIRRGPMKTPTTGTSVFSPAIYTGDDVNGRLISSGFPVDSAIIDPRNGYATPGGPNWFSRLTGNGYFLQTAQTNAESNGNSNSNGIMGQDGITVARTGTNVWSNVASNTYVSWFLRRAPGFFDEVCYTTGAGTGQTTFSHNLGVTPELIISKIRSTIDDWYVYAQPRGTSKTLYLNYNLAEQSFACAGGLSSTQATTYLGVGSATAVSYLFASCPGVSKVGAYTGTGATQTISCGFAARFVLIKRADGTGSWLVWDTARGMVSGTDPRLQLNTTAGDLNSDWVYTNASGFQIVATDAQVNASGGSYIYLAIA